MPGIERTDQRPSRAAGQVRDQDVTVEVRVTGAAGAMPEPCGDEPLTA